MEFMFDTANLEQIKRYLDIFPISGVTTNPTILKAEGGVPFFAHMRGLRAAIGQERSLHIQVTCGDCEGMVREGMALLAHVDGNVYIKIPTTLEGLKAMRRLKAEGARITATAIYSRMQGMMAVCAGADYIAPYYNRMENMDIAAADTISALRQAIAQAGAPSKILAASFKNTAQVNEALLAGAHAVTVQPDMLADTFRAAQVQRAVDDFHADWVSAYGDTSIAALAEG